MIEQKRANQRPYVSQTAVGMEGLCKLSFPSSPDKLGWVGGDRLVDARIRTSPPRLASGWSRMDLSHQLLFTPSRCVGHQAHVCAIARSREGRPRGPSPFLCPSLSRNASLSAIYKTPCLPPTTTPTTTTSSQIVIARTIGLNKPTLTYLTYLPILTIPYHDFPRDQNAALRHGPRGRA